MKKNLVKFLAEKLMRVFHPKTRSGSSSRDVKKTANIHLQ